MNNDATDASTRFDTLIFQKSFINSQGLLLQSTKLSHTFVGKLFQTWIGRFEIKEFKIEIENLYLKFK